MAYRTPRDLAESMARRRKATAVDDGFVRESFTLDRQQAGIKARKWRERWPAAACMFAVDTWRELPGDRIAFSIGRVRSAD